MKKALGSALVLTAAFLSMIVVSACGDLPGTEALIQKKQPSTEVVSLYEYFEKPDEGELPVIIDFNRPAYSFMLRDDRIYVRLDILKNEFNNNFFYESETDTLLFTSLDGIYEFTPGAFSYTGPDGEEAPGFIPVISEDDQLYVDIEIAETFSFFEHELVGDDPERIIIWRDETDITEFTRVTAETQLRTGPDIDYPILAQLTEESDPMYLLSEPADPDTVGDTTEGSDDVSGFTEVMTKDGIRGFVASDCLEVSNEAPIHRSDDRKPHDPKLLDEKVCMVWHQLGSYSGNTDITDILSYISGVNVISPTWFYIDDNDGNVAEIGSTAYVTLCHDAGIAVWGLVSNFGNPEINSDVVLNNRSSRRNLEEQLMALAEEYSLDGINIDFESMLPEAGEGYVQFIREMALKCRERDIILSVDNYVPTEYTAFYGRREQAQFADYIVVMAYDEHWNGSDAGSVASMDFVEDGIIRTVNQGVPKEQIIQANPFYTRVWCESPKTDVEIDTVEAASEDFSYYELTSEAVGMREGMRRLTDNDADIQYLEDIGQNYGEYESEGNRYKIWLEDETSVKNRMELFKRLDVGGVAFWKIGLEKNDIWGLIREYLE